MFRKTVIDYASILSVINYCHRFRLMFHLTFNSRCCPIRIIYFRIRFVQHTREDSPWSVFVCSIHLFVPKFSLDIGKLLLMKHLLSSLINLNKQLVKSSLIAIVGRLEYLVHHFLGVLADCVLFALKIVLHIASKTHILLRRFVISVQNLVRRRRCNVWHLTFWSDYTAALSCSVVLENLERLIP